LVARDHKRVIVMSEAPMLIDKNGEVKHPRVTLHIISGLAQARMGTVHGIIVHQTGGATAEAAFAGYKARPYGTHFLIDKDGTIYQNASLLYYTNHVGKLKARCLAEHVCTPVEMKAYAKFSPSNENRLEMTKSPPNRYPANRDSIGIELVGEVSPKTGVYVTVTDQQNASLHWLVSELSLAFSVPMREVFRHPQVSRKTPSEASTAKW